MASQQTNPAAAASLPPPAPVVGNAFVNQYYHILHQSPELVYRFYKEGSKLGRPDTQGAISTITTMQAINEKILSMGYSEFRAEIKTVDAQESVDGGVLVLVTGFLTGKDNVRKNFTQSFFLATQDNGYFVLNDIFRYVEEDGDDHLQPNNQLSESGIASPDDKETPPQEQQLPQQSAPLPEAEEEVNEDETCNPSENGEGLVVVKEEPVDEMIDEVPDGSLAAVNDSSSAALQEEAPKKSYASIVKDMKDNIAPTVVPSPSPSRTAPTNSEHQAPSTLAPVPAPAPAPAPALAPALIPATEIPVSSANATETTSVQEEVDGRSIYIRSLPLNATPVQLEEEFKKFGPIKPGGIQVRSHKQQGFCFGFVEFEEASAVQRAIEASPVLISGRQAYVEEKRPIGSRVNTRGRFLPGRGGGFGGFRNDGVRGRGGSYGRGYGRGDYGVRTDFGGRSGGGRSRPSSRGGEVGYQRVNPPPAINQESVANL